MGLPQFPPEPHLSPPLHQLTLDSDPTWLDRLDSGCLKIQSKQRQKRTKREMKAMKKSKGHVVDS